MSRYLIHAVVASVQEHFTSHHVSGVGDKAVMKKQSLGWFVQFEGSYESRFLGFDKPNLQKGDKVRVLIEKEQADATAN